MANTNSYEISSLNLCWIKKKVPASYNNDELKRIVLFFVINTPCIDLSSSGICVQTYGWRNDVWKKGKLREQLLSAAGLKTNQTFFSAKKVDALKETLKKANWAKGFHKDREIERIAMYKPIRYNDFLAVCYHIRNALAHERLAMYPISNSADIVFVLEDGVKKGADFQVRSRMILKRSTLLKWIDIIEAGKLMDNPQNT